MKFVARRGLFIDGSTSPAVANANVSLYRLSTKSDVEASVEIEGQSMILLSSSFTDADGKYHFGPLSNRNTYKVVLHKTGHIFTRRPDSPFDFAAEKLASIRVKIGDVDGVFILLTSSTSSMRRRTATTDSTGEVEFTDLQSGDYYLRPQLREYQFEPEDAQIQLKSGDDVRLDFQTRRTSFSCFGQITSINNEPEANLIVDARPIDQCENLPRESAKTDVNGQFRLRALQPNCRYHLQYRSNPTDSQQNEILTLEPKNFVVEVQNGDVENVHLYTIKRSTDVDLNVFVQTSPQFLNQLKVKLLRISSQHETVVQTITLTNSPFAYFNSLPFDNQSYMLRIESPLSTSVYHFVQPELTFTANQTFLFFTFQFEPRVKIYDGETGLTGSYSAFIIALLIIAFVFKYETVRFRSFSTFFLNIDSVLFRFCPFYARSIRIYVKFLFRI